MILNNNTILKALNRARLRVLVIESAANAAREQPFSFEFEDYIKDVVCRTILAVRDELIKD
jgi:hypothetical protein